MPLTDIQFVMIDLAVNAVMNGDPLTNDIYRGSIMEESTITHPDHTRVIFDIALTGVPVCGGPKAKAALAIKMFVVDPYEKTSDMFDDHADRKLLNVVADHILEENNMVPFRKLWPEFTPEAQEQLKSFLGEGFQP